jgi:hypothetical protein
MVYLRLGRYGDAVEALRYGREVDPRTPDLYNLLSAAYTAQGDSVRAAVTVLEKTLLLGATPETLGQIARVYGEESCAIERGAGWMRLNESCPQIQANLCAADRDLADLLRRARMPDPAAQFAARSAKRGCPVQN